MPTDFMGLMDIGVIVDIVDIVVFIFPFLTCARVINREQMCECLILLMFKIAALPSALPLLVFPEVWENTANKTQEIHIITENLHELREESRIGYYSLIIQNIHYF